MEDRKVAMQNCRCRGAKLHRSHDGSVLRARRRLADTLGYKAAHRET